jgi:hypothetical protein
VAGFTPVLVSLPNNEEVFSVAIQVQKSVPSAMLRGLEYYALLFKGIVLLSILLVPTVKCNKMEGKCFLTVWSVIRFLSYD